MRAIEVKTIKVGECDVVISHKPGKNGYIVICRNGKPNQYLHRAVCEEARGRCPKGKEVLHSCDNRACINKDHLSYGTRKQNAKGAMERNRLHTGDNPGVQGENHGLSKLTNSQVLNIVSMPGKQRVIAAQFGVSQRLVSLIKRREIWRHILRPKTEPSIKSKIAKTFC